MTEQIQANSRISIDDWERSVGSAGMDWLVSTANSLHRTIGLRVRQSAVDIWCAGRILEREKEIVGHGNWMSHCRRHHPEISLDSIERYLRVGQISEEQLPTILDKTPRQAYLMLGLIKKRSLPVCPAEQDRSKVNSAHMRNLEQDSWAHTVIECPHCDGRIELTLKGDLKGDYLITRGVQDSERSVRPADTFD